jgi:hypothetical protein
VNGKYRACKIVLHMFVRGFKVDILKQFYPEVFARGIYLRSRGLT